jgi:c-di-GMP-binding flagellar brake protein YcgR
MFEFIKKIVGGDKKKKTKTEAHSKPVLKISANDRLTVKTEDRITADHWEGIVHRTTKHHFRIQVFPTDKIPDFTNVTRVFVTMNKGDRIARFSVQIAKTAVQGTSCYLDLENPREIEWSYIKKRMHDRLKIKINSKIKPEILKNAPWDTVKLIDISTGGSAFFSSRPYKKDERVIINFLYPYLPEKVIAVIRRTGPAEDETDPKIKYFVGVEFLNLTPKEIEQLSKVCAQLKKNNY